MLEGFHDPHAVWRTVIMGAELSRAASLLACLGAFFSAAGCTQTVTTAPGDKLSPPLGLASVTGDGSVTLSWYASNYGEHRDAFIVYSFQGGFLSGSLPRDVPAGFAPIDTFTTRTEASFFSRQEAGLANGTLYTFLVVAYATGSQTRSAPSNFVTDTPRTQAGGFTGPAVVTLENGPAPFLDLDGFHVLATDSDAHADIRARTFDAGGSVREGIVGQNGARIQDLGFMASWDQADKAPVVLASYPDPAFSIPALEGHAYAIYTGDGHYGKIYVTHLFNPLQGYGFQCYAAYQTDSGNPEYTPRFDR